MRDHVLCPDCDGLHVELLNSTTHSVGRDRAACISLFLKHLPANSEASLRRWCDARHAL